MTTFETKDSGQRQDYASGMRRDVQDNKPDLTSWMNEVPYKESFLYRVGMLASRGERKYGRSNFQLANSQEELDRFKASAFRHLQQWLYGETDEDHAAAVVFNLWAAEMVKYKLGKQSQTPCDMCDTCRCHIGLSPICCGCNRSLQ